MNNSGIKSQNNYDYPDDIEDEPDEDWICTNLSAKSDGGEGSGNFVHKGVKRQLGGSAPNGGSGAKGSWSENFQKVCVQTNGKRMKSHPTYDAAKHGDYESAKKLVSDLAKPERIKQIAEAYPDAKVVLVQSAGDGHNQIPVDYVDAFADAGMEVDYGIQITMKANRTGASELERLKSSNTVSGDVEPGREYVIADDVVTSGASINEYRQYIESKGG